MKPRYMILLNDNPECHKCGMYHEARRVYGKNKVKETWGIQCGATLKIVHSKSQEAMEEELKRQCPILRIGLNDRIEGII